MPHSAQGRTASVSSRKPPTRSFMLGSNKCGKKLHLVSTIGARWPTQEQKRPGKVGLRRRTRVLRDKPRPIQAICCSRRSAFLHQRSLVRKKQIDLRCPDAYGRTYSRIILRRFRPRLTPRRRHTEKRQCELVSTTDFRVAIAESVQCSKREEDLRKRELQRDMYELSGRIRASAGVARSVGRCMGHHCVVIVVWRRD